MDIGHNALQMKDHNVWFQFMYCISRNETARHGYFQNKIVMFCLPNFNFHILVSVNDHRIGLQNLLQQIGGPILGIYIYFKRRSCANVNSPYKQQCWANSSGLSVISLYLWGEEGGGATTSSGLCTATVVYKSILGCSALVLCRVQAGITLTTKLKGGRGGFSLLHLYEASLICKWTYTLHKHITWSLHEKGV